MLFVARKREPWRFVSGELVTMVNSPQQLETGFVDEGHTAQIESQFLRRGRRF
jgi:hypothetical protein